MPIRKDLRKKPHSYRRAMHYRLIKYNKACGVISTARPLTNHTKGTRAMAESSLGHNPLLRCPIENCGRAFVHRAGLASHLRWHERGPREKRSRPWSHEDLLPEYRRRLRRFLNSTEERWNRYSKSLPPLPIETEQLVKNAFFAGTDGCQTIGRMQAQIMYPAIGICEDCQKVAASQRHHIDENTMNNDRANLKFLCKSCHMRRHEVRRTRRPPRACANCGRMETHLARNKCGRCKAYYYRHGIDRPQGDAIPRRIPPTHCVNGHEFNEENTYIRVRDGRPSFMCKECMRTRARTKRRDAHSQGS